MAGGYAIDRCAPASDADRLLCDSPAAKALGAPACQGLGTDPAPPVSILSDGSTRVFDCDDGA